MALDVDVVVFDKGNVLLLDPIIEVLKRQKHEFAKELGNYQGMNVITANEIEEVWTQVNNTINYPFCGHFTQEEGLVHETLNRLGIVITDYIISSFLYIYREGLRKVIEEDPRTQEVRNVLQELKYIGKRLGVFSNDRQEGLNLEFELMKLNGFFEYAMSSEELGIEKPDLRVFEHIASHFSDVPRERIVYVGDVPLVDIEPAKRVGMMTIHYQINTSTYKNIIWRNLEPCKAKPDASVKEFSELLDVIL